MKTHTGPISSKPGTDHPLVEEIQICSNEGIYGLPKREICVKAKYSVTMFKETLLNHSVKLNQTRCKTFSGEIWWFCSNLFISWNWYSGEQCGPYAYCCFYFYVQDLEDWRHIVFELLATLLFKYFASLF